MKVTIQGTISSLTGPREDAEVQVAANIDRPAEGGLLVAAAEPVPVVRGEVSFEAEEGPATLFVRWGGERTFRRFPMTIAEGYSLEDALRAGALDTVDPLLKETVHYKLRNLHERVRQLEEIEGLVDAVVYETEPELER